MLKKIITFILSAKICLITEGVLSLPTNPKNESQVPRLTLRIPMSNISIPESLRESCESGDGRATGRPFGFNKVQYINSDVGTEIFGCITNNSRQTVGGFLESQNFFEAIPSSIVPPPSSPEEIGMSQTVSEGKFLLPLVTLGPIVSPSRSRFFRWLILPDYMNEVTLIIRRPSSPGQDKTYVPVQHLKITIVR
jgi:hypothetical protein